MTTNNQQNLTYLILEHIRNEAQSTLTRQQQALPRPSQRAHYTNALSDDGA